MNSIFSRIPEPARNALAAAGALMLVLGSFMTVSGDLDINAPFGLAAAMSSLSGRPTIAITRNVNSPVGTVIPGRSQVLAVYDVTPRNLAQYATLQRMTVSVQVNSTQLNATGFMLNYSYCTSAGNVYNYGYQYGYSGTYCQAYSAFPVSSARVGNAYTVTFVPNFPIVPGQTLSSLSLSGIAYYAGTASAHAPNATIRARVTSDTAIQTTQCKTIRYGYHGLYSYVTCLPVGMNASVPSAIGNSLSVLRNYGYGYSYAYPTITPSPSPVPPVTSTTTSAIAPAPAPVPTPTGTVTTVRRTR